MLFTELEPKNMWVVLFVIFRGSLRYSIPKCSSLSKSEGNQEMNRSIVMLWRQRKSPPLVSIRASERGARIGESWNVISTQKRARPWIERARSTKNLSKATHTMALGSKRRVVHRLLWILRLRLNLVFPATRFHLKIKGSCSTTKDYNFVLRFKWRLQKLLCRTFHRDISFGTWSPPFDAIWKKRGSGSLKKYLWERKSNEKLNGTIWTWGGPNLPNSSLLRLWLGSVFYEQNWPMSKANTCVANHNSTYQKRTTFHIRFPLHKVVPRWSIISCR